MRYKVTNESASTKVLPSATPGMRVFFKPGETGEVDLRQMTSAQIKKFAMGKLYVEEADLADTAEAEVTQPTPAVAAPTPAPAAPPPSKPAPAAKAPSAAPTEGVPPAPEPWQKGLEPPK